MNNDTVTEYSSYSCYWMYQQWNTEIYTCVIFIGYLRSCLDDDTTKNNNNNKWLDISI